MDLLGVYASSEDGDSSDDEADDQRNQIINESNYSSRSKKRDCSAITKSKVHLDYYCDSLQPKDAAITKNSSIQINEKKRKQKQEPSIIVNILDGTKTPTPVVATKTRNDDTNDTITFVRTVPHIRGNWAGHVFIKLEISSQVRKRLHNLARKSIIKLQRQLLHCKVETCATKNRSGRSSQTLRDVEGSIPCTTEDCDKKNSLPKTVTIVSHVPWEKRNISNKSGNNSCIDAKLIEELSSSSDDEEFVSNNSNDNKIKKKGLHLSLSRPFYLHLSSIPSFVNDISQRLSNERAFTIVVQRTIHPSQEPSTMSQPILLNDDKTRSFLYLSVKQTSSSSPSFVSPLQRLLNNIDQVLVKYRQTTYYEKPLFHVSIASMKGNIQPLLLSSTSLSKTMPRRKNKQQEEPESSITPFASTNGNANVDGLGSSDESCSEEDDDYDDEQVIISIKKINCTFGTTKEFCINLLP